MSWLVATFFMYADDTRVYGSCRPASVDDFSSRISECVGAVSSWMKSNRLSLNCSKTVRVSRQVDVRRQHQLPSNALSIDRSLVNPVKSVRSRSGHLLMRTHVQRTVSRCFAVLRQLSQIRRLVPTDVSDMFQTLVASQSSANTSGFRQRVLSVFRFRPTWSADSSRC